MMYSFIMTQIVYNDTDCYGDIPVYMYRLAVISTVYKYTLPRYFQLNLSSVYIIYHTLFLFTGGHWKWTFGSVTIYKRLNSLTLYD